MFQSMVSERQLGLCLFAIVFTSLSGCGDGGPELASVKGVVTVDGQPVPNATLTFVPQEGSPSYGQTDRNGSYELMFTDVKRGAMLGSHQVSIEGQRLSKEELAEMKAQGMDVPDRIVEIPKAYRQAGALTAEVKRGSNAIDFHLEAKSK
ncbi:MAG: carboxypeptidase-like regulatory domain-containing protein [Pirellula sp.]|nr:carboxypeptidase-like regulatory domain-containing protein [Pirellula sp.]